MLPGGRITTATTVPAGSLSGLTGQPITAQPIKDLPSFCRVAATLTPSSDSNIKIEVWLPLRGWNGKYQGTGNGGYAGHIAYGSLAAGLRRGYATANTDLGTSDPSGNPDALTGHAERWADWGWRATHEMTNAARQIIQAFYGTPPTHSYFVGCSTGGQQALVEAQRFPDDYDGILAGAPANNRTRLHMAFIWDAAAFVQEPGSAIPPSKLQLISDAVGRACSAHKAVPSDPFLSTPQSCTWNPAALLCHGADASGCLTAAQVTTAQKLYDGPSRGVAPHAKSRSQAYARLPGLMRNSGPMRNPGLNNPELALYPGLTRGSELAWGELMPQTDHSPGRPDNAPGRLSGHPIYDTLFKWVFGRQWNWRTFDFDHDADAVDQALAGTLNATNPDLSAFKAHGHKLIVFHGWSDAIVPSLESINYDRSVINTQSTVASAHGKTALDETRSFYRLFMVPGMAHCGGGPGLNEVEALPSLERWVEKGVAPDWIVARRMEDGVTRRSRPVCSYPNVEKYNGAGDANDAASFSCSK